jgi:multisubunit Na+/H+ antiporter MnhC subunit
MDKRRHIYFIVFLLWLVAILLLFSRKNHSGQINMHLLNNQINYLYIYRSIYE